MAGDIKLSSNFELQGQRPLDDRDVIDTIANRDLIPFVRRYDGLPVYVEETKLNYRLVLGTVDNDLNNNANWALDKGSTKENLTAGTGLTGLPFDGSAAREWALNFGTSAGTAAEGNHTHTGYISSTDPRVTQWDTAYGWGNHADEGYLTSFTETDPTVPAHVKTITTTNLTQWTAGYNHSTIVTGNPHNLNAADVGAAEINHTHAILTAGTGLSSSGTYNGSTARTFSLNYASSGGDNGVSSQPARFDHSHSEYTPSFTSGTISHSVGSGNASYAHKLSFSNYSIVNINVAVLGPLNINFNVVIGNISSSSFRPTSTVMCNLTHADASGTSSHATSAIIDSNGDIIIKQTGLRGVSAGVYLQGNVTFIRTT